MLLLTHGPWMAGVKLWLKDGEWEPVTGATEYGVALNQFNRAAFEPVTTSGLKI